MMFTLAYEMFQQLKFLKIQKDPFEEEYDLYIVEWDFFYSHKYTDKKLRDCYLPKDLRIIMNVQPNYD